MGMGFRGGVAAELFLRAAGVPVGVDTDGGDRFRTQWAQTADEIAAIADTLDAEVLLPTDLAYADAAGERAEVAVDAIAEKTTPYLDIGTATAERYAAVCAPAAAVFVKGALGVFEDPRFARGPSPCSRRSPTRTHTASSVVVTPRGDRKSTRLNSSHITRSRMPSSA